MVIWNPRRSAAEHLVPSHFHSVTASVDRSNGTPHHASRTVTGRAVIDRPAKIINSAKASPGGIVNCPLIDSEYTLKFHPTGPQKTVLISAVGCMFVGVKVGAHSQPTLVDNGHIERAISQLLHPR